MDAQPQSMVFEASAPLGEMGMKSRREGVQGIKDLLIGSGCFVLLGGS